jgi:hypothetical protein
VCFISGTAPGSSGCSELVECSGIALMSIAGRGTYVAATREGVRPLQVFTIRKANR